MEGPLSDSKFGGILLYCDDFSLMQSFYKEKLGLNVDQCGKSCASFNANGLSVTLRPGKPGATPRTREHLLIGFKVANIDDNREKLIANGVAISGIKEYGFGKCAEITDPEGNIIAIEEPR